MSSSCPARGLWSAASLRGFVLLLVGLLVAALGLAAPAHAQREPARPATAFSDALALYHQRLYAQAADALYAFRRAYPGSPQAPEALFYEANAALATDRAEDAIRLLEALEARYPAHPLAQEAQVSLSRYFVEEGDYARARETLRRVVERDPEGPQAARALYALGTVAVEEGAFGDAEAAFRRVANDYPEAEVAPAGLYALASAQLQQGRQDAAAQSLEELSARYAGSPYARTLGLSLAELYYQLGQYEETVREVEKRLPELEGEDADRARFLRAEAYNQLRNTEEAIVAYRRIIEDHAESAYYRPARYGLAWNYYFGESHQWAADEFAKVHAGRDDALAQKALYYEAVNRLLGGQLPDATALFEQYVRQYPESALADEAQYELALRYYDDERWPDANRAFERYLEDYPEAERSAEARFMLGNTYAAMGDFESALAQYDRAIEQDAAAYAGRREEVAFQRAWVLYRGGRYDQAAGAFTSFLDAYPDGEKPADARFWAAESFFQQGAHGRAEQLFQQYLARHPEGRHVAAARYALGWARFKQGDYGGAAGAFERFLAAYQEQDGEIPYREDALLRLGDSYYAQKRYADAVRTYRRIRGANEDYALYQTAQAQYFDGQLVAAAATLQDLLERFPESTLREEARYRLGYAYFQNQDYDRAADAYRTLIRQYPRDPLAAKAQYGIGDAYFNQGRLDEAARAYRAVLDRYPDSPFASDAASSIQYALLAMDDGGQAEAIADSFAAANPGSAMANELRFRQAETKYQSGQTEAALQDFQRFVRVSNSTRYLPQAYYYMGEIYADRQAYREAENYLMQVIQNYPESDRRVDAAQRLGALYRQQERFSDALRAYRQMEQLAEGNAAAVAEARYGQSMALLAMERTGEAEELLREVTEAAPDAPEAAQARLGLARIAETDGRTEEALRLYREVVRQSDGAAGAEALYRLGALLLGQDQPREAIEELGRMAVLYPGRASWNAQAYLAQADAYRQLGETGTAVRLYDRVISEFGGTAYAQTARRERERLL